MSAQGRGPPGIPGYSVSVAANEGLAGPWSLESGQGTVGVETHDLLYHITYAFVAEVFAALSTLRTV
jgi:hypothetical protein